MNIALIMDTRQPMFLSKAQELNVFLQTSGWTGHHAELWLFYDVEKPSALPQMVCPIRRVYWISLPPPALPEQQIISLMACCQPSVPDVLLFTSGEQGDELATRLAFRLGGVSSAGVTQAESGECWQASQPAYGNRLQVTLALNGSPLCLSVAATGAKPAQAMEYLGEYADCPVSALPPDWLASFRQERIVPDNRLGDAPYIFALGQGIGSADNLQSIRDIAYKSGAEIGVSRPVAMNAWCEMSRMLGMSGVVVAPKVCIVAGASGAAALMAGVARSEFIVAVNTDPQAAIFAQADVGIVGDLQTVLAELSQYLIKT